MDLQSIANSKKIVQLGLLVARSISPTVAKRMIWCIARLIAIRRNSDLMQGIRLNQWVITGECLTAKELDVQALKVLEHDLQVIYDLYHNLENHSAVQQRVIISPEVSALMEDARNGKGAFAVGPHMSNFDLAMCGMALQKTPIQVLTYAHPGSGYQYQNELRARMGLEVSPIDALSLRRASDRIKAGGLVVTAVDRAENPPNNFFRFFDRLAPMPDGHIRMVLRMHAPLYILHAHMDEKGLYHVLGRGPIEMISHHDRDEEIRINVENVLNEFAAIIRACPEQWLMFYPVWQDVQGMVP